jgi:nitroimidazol reductase NimA-like FMN-containing flavoprotein (pyridoxamine 5'-phosphate oxidase superfamily)
MSTDDHDNRWFEPALLQDLPAEECSELLAAKSVGRVGFNGPDGPQILPLNYVVHLGDIFFRTATEGALSRAMPASRVAFEVDDIDEFMQRGWSVLVVGAAALVDDPDLLAELAGDQGPTPWAAGTRPQVVRIRTDRLTGRRVLPR